MNYDIEKIEEIIDAHEEKHNQQIKYLNYSVVAALVIMLIYSFSGGIDYFTTSA